jgi:class 3 adenylate cyclase
MLITGLTSAVIAVTLAGVLYVRANQIQLDEIRFHVTGIAERAARQIDGDAHARLTDPKFLAGPLRIESLRENPDYRKVLEALWASYRASRDRRTRIVNAYTMAPAGEGRWMYVVEADLDSDLEVYLPGHLYQEGTCPPEVLEQPTADRDFVTDEDGVWLTGYAPIRDSSGRAVGFVGFDMAEADVVARLSPMAWLFVLLGLAALATAWLSGWLVSRWISRPIELLHRGAREVERGNFDHRLVPGGGREISELCRAFNSMVAALRDRERLRLTFSRYVSDSVARKVLAREDLDAMLAGERRRVTILFCDLRGFTAFAESEPPARVFAVLNEYLGEIAGCVFRHGGTLDKFIGDNVMAVFGAPVATGDEAARAVTCAMEMRMRVAAVNERRAARGESFLQVGIGIHCGVAVAGEVGTAERREYTVVGHHVNLAKRIEERCGPGEVLVSEAVWTEVKDLFSGHPGAAMSTEGGLQIQLFAVDSRSGETAPPAADRSMADPAEWKARPAISPGSGRPAGRQPSTRILPIDSPPSRN